MFTGESNQSAVARGYLSEGELQRIHRLLCKRLRRHGIRVDGFYYCPHLPDGSVEDYAISCECRKPRPGLVQRAAAEHGVDTASSWAVGDSERDVKAGKRAGCRTILISPYSAADTCADAVAPDLAAAAGIILADSLKRRGEPREKGE